METSVGTMTWKPLQQCHCDRAQMVMPPCHIVDARKFVLGQHRDVCQPCAVDAPYVQQSLCMALPRDADA